MKINGNPIKNPIHGEALLGIVLVLISLVFGFASVLFSKPEIDVNLFILACIFLFAGILLLCQ